MFLSLSLLEPMAQQLPLRRRRNSSRNQLSRAELVSTEAAHRPSICHSRTHSNSSSYSFG